MRVYAYETPASACSRSRDASLYVHSCLPLASYVLRSVLSNLRLQVTFPFEAAVPSLDTNAMSGGDQVRV